MENQESTQNGSHKMNHQRRSVYVAPDLAVTSIVYFRLRAFSFAHVNNHVSFSRPSLDTDLRRKKKKKKKYGVGFNSEFGLVY